MHSGNAVFLRRLIVGGGLTCVITSAASDPVLAAFDVTITFSEPVTGFAVGDITVVNGSAGSFAGSGAVYTATITPTWAGAISVSVAAGVCIDLAGNANLASNVLSYTINPYFVATTGNDTTGDGSSGAPWKTVNKAIQTIPIAGAASIIIAAGTYVEDTAGGSLLLNRTFLAPVYVQAAPGDSVTISGTGAGASISIPSNAANVIFDHVAITDNGATITVFYNTNATGITNISFWNSTIENTQSGGIAVYAPATQASDCQFINTDVTANTAGNAIAMAIGGKGASSLYLDSWTLTNSSLSGAQYGLYILGGGWISNLSVNGGTYTTTLGTGAAIGKLNSSMTGPTINISISGATVRGNSRGIDLGSNALATPMTNLQILNCDVDTTANKKAGVMIGGYALTLTLDGGSYIGGETGTGFGGVYVNGPGCTNVSITNADISSQAPDPVTNRVLALGVGGTDGLTISYCDFHGDGRAIAIEDNVLNATIEYNTSDAEDMGFRVGHDAAGAYTNHDIIYRHNTVNSLLTVAAIVGEGAWNITIENNVLAGGPGIFRLRGHASNNTITIQNNTCSQNPLYAGTPSVVAAVEAYGPQNVTFTGNAITGDFPSVWKTYLEGGTLASKDNVFTGNTVEVAAGNAVYDIGASDLDTGNVWDTNDYTFLGSIDFGTLLGSAVTSLADAQTEWDGYGAGTNDDNSTATT